MNLLFGWVWISLGFVSGAFLGLRFNKEGWLGGDSSLRRRLYRLAHISFFGLGVLNILLSLTLSSLEKAHPVAEGAFILGAVTMPLACILFASNPRLKWLFGIPVAALLLGTISALRYLF